MAIYSSLSLIPIEGTPKKGVDWLRKQKSAILADDMGLGKTLQAIAAFEKAP